MTGVKFHSAAFDFARMVAEENPSDEDAIRTMLLEHRETIVAALDQAALREARAAEIERSPDDWKLVEFAIALDGNGGFSVGEGDDFDTAADGLGLPIRCCVVAFHMRLPKIGRAEIDMEDLADLGDEVVPATGPLTERLPTDIA